MQSLLAGIKLHDEPQPVAAFSWRKVGEHKIEIVLKKSKYHQVRRMLAAAGNHCSALRRTAIGGLTLNSLELELGEWLYLEPEHLALLVPA